jgi:transposase
MHHYIGIDVSKEELFVFDGETEVKLSNKRGLKALYTYITKRFSDLQTVIIIFESTGPYSAYLKEFCALHEIKASIVNPKKSANFTKTLGNRSKTDRFDARMLYEFRRLIDPHDITVPEIDTEAAELSEYLSTYQFLVKSRTALSNHHESLKHNPHAPKELVTMVKRECERAKKREQDLLDKIVRYIESNEDLRKAYRKLVSITSIGKVSAIALLTLFKTYKATNRSQITALVGLDPTRAESGTSVRGRRKISKSGNRTVRKILYFPTLNAIQHNTRVKATYERLVRNHKPKKLAVIAAMRKLLLIAHAVYKSETVFSPA